MARILTYASDASIVGDERILITDSNNDTLNLLLDDLAAFVGLGFQETLVSGSNIKTINGVSVLGSGDIAALIEGQNNTLVDIAFTNTGTQTEFILDTSQDFLSLSGGPDGVNFTRMTVESTGIYSTNWTNAKIDSAGDDAIPTVRWVNANSGGADNSLSESDQTIANGITRNITLSNGTSVFRVDRSDTSSLFLVQDGNITFSEVPFLTSGALQPSNDLDLVPKGYADGLVANSADWDAAFGWGDHASAGYSAWSDAVNSNILPDSDSTRNLGTAANRFLNIYSDVLYSETASLGNTISAFYGIDLITSGGTEIFGWNGTKITYGVNQLADEDFVTSQGYLTSVDIADINTTGTADVTTFLRGDGQWTVISGGSGDAWSDPVDSDILSDVTSTRSLGSISNRFLNIYVDSFDFNTGVWGDGALTSNTVNLRTSGGNVVFGWDGTKLNYGSEQLADETYVNAQGFLTAVAISDITATGTPDNTTYLRGDGQWDTISGGITAENQRKIDNSRSFLPVYYTTDQDIDDMTFVTHSLANDENKKIAITVENNDVDFTLKSIANGNTIPVGETVIIDADGTGLVRLIGSEVTMIGFDMSGSNDSASMDGTALGAGVGRIMAFHKKPDVWRLSGNYTGFTDLLPHPNDNNANPDLVTGISLGFGSDNANVTPTQTGGAPFNSTVTTVQDSGNGYVEYITEVTATGTSFSRGQSTFTLESGETYNYFIYYETPNGATDMRIRSNSGFVTEFNHSNLTGSGTLSGTVVADATSCPIEYWANNSAGVIGDKARFLISFEKQ